MEEDEAGKLQREFTPQRKSKRKALENRWIEGLTIPVAIILVGALIVFGITKMLSSGKDHRDLVREMESRTFGNRWVAAFELSKLVASGGIPPSEIPWLAENLGSLYTQTLEPRTQNFIIITLGALKHPSVLPILESALDSKDNTIVFSAVVAVGNLPEGMDIHHWPKLISKLQAEDEGIRHATVLALATKKVQGAQQLIEEKLQDPSLSVRYGAALASIPYHSKKAEPMVREMIPLETHHRFNPRELQKLRLSLISAIGREKWTAFEEDLKKVIRDTGDLKVETTAREALNLLKI